MQGKNLVVYTFSLICAVVLVLGAASAWAIGNIKIGQIAVHPSITEKGMWDSNINLNADNGVPGEESKSDFINTITPRIDLQLKKELIDLNLGGWVDIVRYKDYDKNDTENYTFNFNGTYGSIGRTGLYFKAKEWFSKTQDPYQQSGVGDPRYKNGIPVKKDVNVAGIEVGYGLLDRYALHLSYTNNYLKYKEEQDRDSSQKQHVAGCSLYYRILPKTFLSLGYEYTVADYFDYSNPLNLRDVGKDSKSHSVTVGALWDNTEKLNGTVKFGYEWKRWDHSIDNQGDNLDNIKTWIASVNLGWKPLQRTTVYFNVERGEEDTEYTDCYSYDKFLAAVTLDQKIAYKLGVQLGVKYENDDYNQNRASAVDRKDDLYEANAGLSYDILQWLRAEVGYTYRKNDSNVSNENYKDHLTTFKIGGYF